MTRDSDNPIADDAASPGTPPPPPPLPLPPTVRVRRLVTLFVWAVVILLALHFFKSVRLLLLGLLAAACLAATVRPLMRYVPARRGISAVVVGLGPIVIAAGAMVLLSFLLAGPIRQQLQQIPQIRQRINDVLARWSNRIGLDQPVTAEAALSQLRELIGDAGSSVVSTTASIVSAFLIALVFIFIGSIYLLVEREGRLLGPVLPLLPPHRRPQLLGALNDLEPRLRWWLLGTLFSMTVTGVAAGIGYAIIGVEFALALAVLAGLSEIVPTLGPAVAFLVALLVAATQGTSAVIGVIVVYAIVQFLESYVLLPMVMREAVSIPPIVTLFSIIFWAQLFGPPGLLLALPIDLAIWSFVDHFLIRPRREREHANAPPAPA